MYVLNLVDIKKNPSCPLLLDRFKEAGLSCEATRTETGIHLSIEGHDYYIPFNDWIETNFKKGDDFRFRHWTPFSDMYYALAA